MKFNENIKDLKQKMNDAPAEEKVNVMMDAMQAIVNQSMQEKIVEFQVANQEVQADASAAVKHNLRTLNKEETKFYELLRDPKQLLGAFPETDLDYLIPTTITNYIFEDLKRAKGLFEHITWAPATLQKWFLSEVTGKAVWGAIDSKIESELTAEIEMLDLSIGKLSAWAFIPLPIFELGLPWVDKFIREALNEALEEGLEEGFIIGGGPKVFAPVGLTKNLTGVTDGDYTDRAPVDVADFSIGSLSGAVTTLTAEGTKELGKLVLITNPLDSVTLVANASKILTANADYKTIYPYDIVEVTSPYVEAGTAILYKSKTYVAGISRLGIDTSEHYKFLEDQLTYKVRAVGNGRLRNDTDAVVLNIADLAPLALNVNVVNADEISSGV